MMTKAFLIILAIFTLGVRPVFTFLFFLFKPLKFVKRRIDFEKKNPIDDACFYFDKIKNRTHHKTDFCFFVSSEGEFEQVIPLIEEVLLQSHAKIEIVYTSESVDRKIHDFQIVHKDRVQILRLPLMLFFPVPFLVFQPLWNWVKAKNIVLCRYDFFPEILLLKLFGKKLILVSATIKNKKIHFLRRIFLKMFYPLFDFVFYASNNDKEKLDSFTLGKDFPVFDFRVQRIVDRIAKREQKLIEDKKLSAFLQSINPDQSLIIGSLWRSDADIIFTSENLQFFKNLSVSVFIFPHKLKDQALAEFVFKKVKDVLPFKKIQSIEELQHLKVFSNDPTVYYIDIGGILVECYSYFKLAYVGGGFERSIHSVLEPYIAGSRVLTGPKTHRSTEWDLVSQDELELSHLSIKNAAEFGNYLQLYFKEKNQSSPMAKIETSKNYQSLLQWNNGKTASFIKQFMND